MQPSTYKALADALVVVHLAFVIFAIFGCLLVLWRRWIAFLHVPSVLWVIYVAAENKICPLTPWENDLRRHAGEAGYQGGFVDHYLSPILYPDGLTDHIQNLMAVGILGLTLACYTIAVLSVVRKRRRLRRVGMTPVDLAARPAEVDNGASVIEQTVAPQ